MPEDLHPLLKAPPEAAAGRVTPEFWCLVVATAHRPISRLLASSQLDPSQAEDIQQDLVVYLLGRPEIAPGLVSREVDTKLLAYLRRLAVCYTLRWLTSERRRRTREERAVRGRVRSECDCASEAELCAVFDELVALMDEPDRARLAALMDRDSRPGNSYPPRTLRHWSLRLYRRYAGRLA